MTTDIYLFPDRLSGHQTSVALLVLAAVLYVYQQVRVEPITCDYPAQFTQASILHARKACYNSHYFKEYHIADEIPREDSFAGHLNHKLAERLPFILLAIAGLLYIPVLMWLVLQRHPAVPLLPLLSIARHCHSARDSSTYQRLCIILSRRLGQHIMGIKKNKRCAMFTTLCNAYLCLTYALNRVLTIVLIVLAMQRILLTLGPHSFFTALHGSAMTMENNTIDYFPSQILCDYRVRRLGRVQRYAFDCMLDHNVPITVLSLLYTWLSILVALNAVTLLNFLITAAIGPCLGGGVKPALRSMGVKEDGSIKFGLMLGWDGVLMSRFVSQVSSAAVAAEMIAGAYYMVQQETGDQQPNGGYQMIPFSQTQPTATAAPPAAPPAAAPAAAPAATMGAPPHSAAGETEQIYPKF